MPGILDYGLHWIRPPHQACGTTIYAVGHHTRVGVPPGGMDLTFATYGLLVGTSRPGWIRIGGRHLELQQGDVVLLFPGSHYHYGPRAATLPWPHAVALWDGVLPRSLHRAGVLDPRRPLWRPADPAAVPRAFAACAPGTTTGMPGALLTLLESALAGRSLVDLPCRRPHRIDRLLAQMAEDPRAAWDLHAEARDLGLSMVQLRRLIRSRTGDPPERHLARLRMQQASRWLLAGMPGHRIADRLGMHDASHFSRRFRELMGASPSAWLTRLQTRSG